MSDIRYAVVPAGGADVMTFTTGGVIYLPMRPFCDALGIDWSNERKRISADPILSKAVVKFTTAFSSGQEQLCLPLTHFHGWLFKLNLNTINERARPVVEALQVEGIKCSTTIGFKAARPTPVLSPSWSTASGPPAAASCPALWTS